MDSDKLINFIFKLVEGMKAFVNTAKRLFMDMVTYTKDCLNKGNKRVIYLIRHSKKYRIRKKNVHRLMRC